MGRLILRTGIYFTIVVIFALLFEKVSGTIGLLLLGAFVLALFNTLIRPVFTVLAFPANLITLGLASVFVNMLTITISDAIVGGIAIEGFWINMLMAVVVMLADMVIRKGRKKILVNREYGV
ncbi:MAG: phage holin family protein [Clostridiales bacterium]|nr:phage holin family protein [Clostridiales bacterium]